jgi:hypothetical protein
MDALRGFPKSFVDAANSRSRRDSSKILSFINSVKKTYDTVCLAGIGGALGAWALDCGLRGPQLQAHSPFPSADLDNVDRPDESRAGFRIAGRCYWSSPSRAAETVAAFDRRLADEARAQGARRIVMTSAGELAVAPEGYRFRSPQRGAVPSVGCRLVPPRSSAWISGS